MFRRVVTLFVCSIGAIGAAGAASAAASNVAVPAYITAAVADASRPDSDRQRDVNRKPDQVLAFAGVKPGDQVGELLPGRGYFTKIFCKIVGDRGHVYAVGVTPAAPPAGAPPPPDMPSAPPSNAAAGAGTPCTNVTSSSAPAAEFKLPAKLDLVWTSENYHDLINPMFGAPDMAAFNKTIYDALKPGGVYMVEDHAAAAGSGTRDSVAMHRIDPATVIATVTGVGFKLEARSELLANAEDPHTDMVFKLNGKSDKFLLKFRKPSK
jgi:predicted methyltransferase